MVKPLFFTSTRRPAGTGGGHVCFAGKGIPAVKAAWEGGVAAGGSDDGAPGNRPQYGPAYYSAYLRDPDGYRVEVAAGNEFVGPRFPPEGGAGQGGQGRWGSPNWEGGADPS